MSSNQKVPNFFIIGAPKCGTTSLAEYLREHPNVFFTDPKEPHYVASDLPRKELVSNDEEYLQLYAGATDQHTARGEGSVWGLYSEVAATKILQLNPEARIIVMLRNPVEQVQSMHSYWVAIGMEDQLSFRKAWALQDERLQGRQLPRASKVRRLYQYAEIAKFGQQVKRLLDTVPASQVKIVLLEDLKRDAEKVYSEILDFLDLEEPEQPLQFDVHNENKVVRSTFIASAVRRIPTILEPYVKAFKRVTGIKNLHIMHMINKLEKRVNQKPGRRQTIDEETKSMLCELFREDVSLLEELLDRDLGHWLK